MRQSWISWIKLITGSDPPEQRAVKGLKSIARNSSSASTQKPWSKVMPKPLVIFTSAVPLTHSNAARDAVSESFLMFEETALTLNLGRYCRMNKLNILEEAILLTVCFRNVYQQCYLCKLGVTLINGPHCPRSQHLLAFKREMQGAAVPG